jgi:hypothetical protein
MKRHFVAVHESDFGTKRTWPSAQLMSAYDPMYGPAVSGKKILPVGGERSCINVSDL